MVHGAAHHGVSAQAVRGVRHHARGLRHRQDVRVLEDHVQRKKVGLQRDVAHLVAHHAGHCRQVSAERARRGGGGGRARDARIRNALEILFLFRVCVETTRVLERVVREPPSVVQVVQQVIVVQAVLGERKDGAAADGDARVPHRRQRRFRARLCAARHRFVVILVAPSEPAAQHGPPERALRVPRRGERLDHIAVARAPSNRVDQVGAAQRQVPRPRALRADLLRAHRAQRRGELERHARVGHGGRGGGGHVRRAAPDVPGGVASLAAVVVFALRASTAAAAEPLRAALVVVRHGNGRGVALAARVAPTAPARTAAAAAEPPRPPRPYPLFVFSPPLPPRPPPPLSPSDRATTLNARGGATGRGAAHHMAGEGTLACGRAPRRRCRSREDARGEVRVLPEDPRDDSRDLKWFTWVSTVRHSTHLGTRSSPRASLHPARKFRVPHPHGVRGGARRG